MKFCEYVTQREKQSLKRKAQNIGSKLAKVLYIPLPTHRENTTHHGEVVRLAENIWKNDKKFHQWLSSHGVKSNPKEFPPHADGGVGRVYFLDDKIVKFTGDQLEAFIAKLSINMNAPVEIIDVYKIGPIWAILQNLADTQNVPQQIKMAADIVTGIIDDYPGMDKFPDATSSKQKMAAEAIKKYGEKPFLIPYIVKIMEVLNRFYMATGHLPDDAGPTNIALKLRKGSDMLDPSKIEPEQIITPDVGPAFSTKRPQEYLKKIHRSREKLGLPTVEFP